MIIAVLSGKGGTGKTFVAVNLADVIKDGLYADCDVEEPNGYLFFKPNVYETKEVVVDKPRADEELCNGCKVCVDFCKFNALAYTKNLIVFEDICHSCGGCALVCPQKAIVYKKRNIGVIEKGKSLQTTVITGKMKEGVASGVPIINQVINLDEINNNHAVIDCPPGSACVVMESIKDADFCILVAEPTLFGEHNLNMVYELVKIFNKPMGVVLNKTEDSYNPSEEFCKKKGIKILAKIPYDKKLASLGSQGKIASRELAEYKQLFINLSERVKKEAK